MSPSRKAITGRTIVDELLGRGMTREIWTGDYEKALPISVQDFDLGAVLPAVFYMFRRGVRRGKGKFLDTFGEESARLSQRKRATTSKPPQPKLVAWIERVAHKLAQTAWFEGFKGQTECAILGDLLLCFSLENAKHALGRTEQIQRVAPAHYMSSWVDLPESVADLRYVLEMIVAMLADQ
jgi:hypothetical protein